MKMRFFYHHNILHFFSECPKYIRTKNHIYAWWHIGSYTGNSLEKNLSDLGGGGGGINVI